MVRKRYNKSIMHKDKQMADIKVPVGTILMFSIGCGCDDFWQVVEATKSQVKARKLKTKAINVKIKWQTCDYVPQAGKFEPPEWHHKYDRYGNDLHKDFDINTVVLKITTDTNLREGFRIGPLKRMMGWSIWNGKPQEQWSP